MGCMDDLFDEILEDIFKRLPRQSRLTCKEVCQRWLEILMTRAVFREDRHIYFDNWINNDISPYTVFANTKFAYENLTFCKGFGPPFGKSFRKLEDGYLCWRHLGKSIKNIDLTGSLLPIRSLFPIFCEIPNVEELTGLSDFDHDTITLLKNYEEKGPFLPNLKKIEFNHNFNCKYRRNKADKLRKIFSNDLKIVYRTYKMDDTSIGELDWILESAPEEFRILVTEDPGHFSQKLLSFEKLPEMKIGLTFFNEPNFEYLDAFVDKHSDIKNVSISSDFTTLFPKPYKQITELIFDVQSYVSVTSFKVFENLECLEKLTFEGSGIDEELCRVGHENINLPKLKCLDFYFLCDSIKCYDCAITIATSFPSMEELHVKFDLPDCALFLRLLLNNCHKLKKISFKGNNLKKFDRFIDLEVQPNLEVLKIKCNQETEEDFEKILIKIFPNLRELTIHFKEIKNLENSLAPLLREFLQGLPKLKRLTIRDELSDERDFTEVKYASMRASLRNILENHGQLLRRLVLPTFLINYD